MINFDFSNECYQCGNCKNVCPKKAIQYIEVTSDSDFNDYMAGSSLRDIVKLNFMSFYAVLKREVEENALFISKPLNQITEDDLAVVGSEGMGFRFLEMPSKSQVYNFTVTITFDDGTVVSDSVQVAF